MLFGKNKKKQRYRKRINHLRTGRTVKKKWKGTLIRIFAALLFLGGTVFGGTLLRDWLEASPYFRVERIEFSGNRQLTEEHLLQVVRSARHQSLLGLDLDDFRTRLIREPWIRDVQIRRRFPDRLEIKIAEKVPVAFVQDGGLKRLLDGEGRMIVAASDDFEGLPEIRGIRVENWIRGDVREIHLVHRGAEFIENSAKPNFLFARNELKSVLMRSEDDLEATIGGLTFLFRYPYPAQQWLKFLSVKNDILAKDSRPEAIDLRYTGKVIIRPGKDKV